MVVIEARYEYWSANGKVFTKWFPYAKAEDESQAKKLIKTFPKTCNKEKREYRIAD